MGYVNAEIDAGFVSMLEARSRRDHCAKMGDAAFFEAAAQVDALHSCRPDQFQWTPQGGDTRARGLRGKMRLLTTLPALRSIADLDELAKVIADGLVVNQAVFPWPTVRKVLDGFASETPVEKLQQTARLLADGQTLRQAAAAVGINHKTVEKVSVFLGVAEQRALMDMDIAIEAVEHGWTRARIRQETGWGNSKIETSLRAARDLLAEDCA